MSQVAQSEKEVLRNSQGEWHTPTVMRLSIWRTQCTSIDLIKVLGSASCFRRDRHDLRLTHAITAPLKQVRHETCVRISSPAIIRRVDGLSDFTVADIPATLALLVFMRSPLLPKGFEQNLVF